MKHLFIDSDRQTWQSPREPTEAEKEAILNGELQVFKVEGTSFVQAEVTEEEIEVEGSDETEIELVLDWLSV